MVDKAGELRVIEGKVDLQCQVVKYTAGDSIFYVLELRLVGDPDHGSWRRYRDPVATEAEAWALWDEVLERLGPAHDA
jgi:hypothetical protein